MKKVAWLILLVGMLVSLQMHAFQSFIVRKIKVEGLHRVSEAAVLNEVAVKPGQTITENQASETIRRLYQTGFFKEASLSREGDSLVVHVKERPTISKLTLAGIKDNDKVQKILTDAGIAEGRFYDPSLLLKAQKELEKHYFTKGKYGVKIEPSVSEADGLVSITMGIYEGDVAKIKQVRIIGNRAFSERELTKNFYSTKTNMLSWFTNDNQYAKEKLNADLENLRSFYMDRGYIRFQIDSVEVSLTPDKKHIHITIHISEGEKYHFGRITLNDCAMPNPHFAKIVAKVHSGQVFSRKVLLDLKQALEDKMGADGYRNGEARLGYDIIDEQRAVNVSFDLFPGDRVYVRRIIFTGNLTTQDIVLRRELPQMEGACISTILVKEGKERIMRRGYASNIEIEMIPIPECPDQVDVVYKIEEARLGQIGAGLAYSGSERLMFNFNLSQQNFMGTGKIVDFNFDKSKASTNYAFGYQDPYFTIDGIGMGFSTYYNQSNLSKTSHISQYTTDTMGAEMRWIFPISRFEAFRISLGYDNTELKINPNPAVTASEILFFVAKYGTSFPEFKLGMGWVYNSLDEPLFPHCGLSASLGFQGVIPGARQQYYLAKYDMSYFYPLTESMRWIFNFNTSLGFGNGYGDTPRLPFYRNFYAGGTRFVRGFEENTLGPKDNKGRAFGGNLLVSATAALIFPNPIKPDARSIRTSLFLDAGQVYDTYSANINGVPALFKSDGLRYSVGVSLTWHSPLGAPISFSLAKPLNAKRGDQTKNFNFWMGTQF